MGIDPLHFNPFTKKLEKTAYFPSNCNFLVLSTYIPMHPNGDYDMLLFLSMEICGCLPINTHVFNVFNDFINGKGTKQWLQNLVYKFCPLSSRFLFAPSSSREPVRRLSIVMVVYP